jgi:hypothetical protein
VNQASAVSVEIQTKQLPNINLDLYRCTTRLGDCDATERMSRCISMHRGDMCTPTSGDYGIDEATYWKRFKRFTAPSVKLILIFSI